jgi:hypothetical protein
MMMKKMKMREKKKIEKQRCFELSVATQEESSRGKNEQGKNKPDRASFLVLSASLSSKFSWFWILGFVLLFWKTF